MFCEVPGLAAGEAKMQHRRMRSLVSATSLVAISILAARPALADPLQPSGKWVVDFGEDRCVAYRTFGSRAHPVHLLLKPSPIGDVMQVQVAERGTNKAGTQESAVLTFGDGPPLSILQLQYGADKNQVRMVNLSKEQVTKLSASTSLGWKSRHRDYQLALGPMNKLIETLDKCQVMLADHWNATLTKQMALKKSPSLDKPLMSLFSSDDYPYDAMRKDQSGFAHVVVMVDETGKIADCTMIATSGIAVLDAQTCIILRKRAKFHPASGADGKPTKGIFHQRVNWEMP